jgi:glycine cleavage system H lipoate-binding protein
MQHLQHSPSNPLTLQQTLERLARSPNVDGLALFGSQNATNPVSDYDLLILVSDLPVKIFQMLTHIDSRMADVVFVETAAADAILSAGEAAGAFESMFVQKMLTAQIIYDASGRLQRIREYADEHPPQIESEPYTTWFWYNHLLYHLKRMSQSVDPVYQTAVDLMLMSGISGLTRDVVRMRGANWQGEKAAIRHLQEHDPTYLDLLRACITESERRQKLLCYERLLAHVFDLWTTDVTAVVLRDAAHSEENLTEALNFWLDLLS